MATISNILLTALYSEAYDFEWLEENVRALILDASEITDRSRQFVSELSGELDDSSYSRQNVTGRTALLDDSQSPPRLILTSDDVVFPQLEGTAPDRMVLFVQENDDTDSWILGYYPIRREGSAITLTGDDVIVPPHEDNGWLSIHEKE